MTLLSTLRGLWERHRLACQAEVRVIPRGPPRSASLFGRSVFCAAPRAYDERNKMIQHDEIGDGYPVILEMPEGYPDIKGTIELYLNGVYGIDTGKGVTHLATAEQLRPAGVAA